MRVLLNIRNFIMLSLQVLGSGYAYLFRVIKLYFCVRNVILQNQCAQMDQNVESKSYLIKSVDIVIMIFVAVVRRKHHANKIIWS